MADEKDVTTTLTLRVTSDKAEEMRWLLEDVRAEYIVTVQGNSESFRVQSVTEDPEGYDVVLCSYR